MPEEFRPLPLDRAIEIIQGDDSRLGRSRRRRAIAKLYAAEPHPVRRDALVRFAEKELAALDRARASTLNGSSVVPDLEKRLNEPLRELEFIYPGTRAAAGGSGMFRFHSGAWKFWRWANAVLDQELGPIVTCERTEPTTEVHFDPSTWATTVTSKLTVKRPLADMSPVLDPQSWDTCGPEVWRNAYIAEEVNGEYPIDANYMATKAVTPPPDLGANWAAVFFEQVALDLGGTTLAEMKLLLDIDAKHVGGSAPEYRVAFKLKKSLYSDVGFKRMEGGVARDDGEVIAQEIVSSGTTSTAISFTKTVSLEGWDLVTYLALTAAMQVGLELLGDGLHDWVCCGPAS